MNNSISSDTEKFTEIFRCPKCGCEIEATEELATYYCVICAHKGSALRKLKHVGKKPLDAAIELMTKQGVTRY